MRLFKIVVTGAPGGKEVGLAIWVNCGTGVNWLETLTFSVVTPASITTGVKIADTRAFIVAVPSSMLFKLASIVVARLDALVNGVSAAIRFVSSVVARFDAFVRGVKATMIFASMVVAWFEVFIEGVPMAATFVSKVVALLEAFVNGVRAAMRFVSIVVALAEIFARGVVTILGSVTTLALMVPTPGSMTTVPTDNWLTVIPFTVTGPCINTFTTGVFWKFTTTGPEPLVPGLGVLVVVNVVVIVGVKVLVAAAPQTSVPIPTSMIAKRIFFMTSPLSKFQRQRVFHFVHRVRICG